MIRAWIINNLMMAKYDHQISRLQNNFSNCSVPNMEVTLHVWTDWRRNNNVVYITDKFHLDLIAVRLIHLK